ncbi:molybdopterin-synthase adenylyltransferase MoeB [Olivibacter ginsenosidimutans]|uniref:Molybdopterin-synthase adenylyltransferase MoeB n=1 Tax=Olivibacter ginsenosidimutans TaxID=1176537 RepID=A0ABP9ALS5_9SPHI
MEASERQYYDRQLKLTGFGEQAQLKLRAANVLVVGAGGLGCPLLQYLVTAGVGELGIVDGDRIALSNLHRQILYTRADIGQYKSTVAAVKLKQLQPDTVIKAYNYNLNRDNILALFASYDLIVDGTDNFATRYLVNDACVIKNKPFVSGAIHDFTAQIAVFNYQGGPTYRCLYPEAPAEEICTTCAINGVLNVLPGIVALYMANETIKVITGYGDVLSGKLLLIDIRRNIHQQLKFDLVPQNKQIKQLQEDRVMLGVEEVKYYQQEKPGTQLIDVREEWEFEEDNLGGINIPLHALLARKGEIDLYRPIIFICQTGKRSRIALQLLKEEVNGDVLLAKMMN